MFYIKINEYLFYCFLTIYLLGEIANTLFYLAILTEILAVAAYILYKHWRRPDCLELKQDTASGNGQCETAPIDKNHFCTAVEKNAPNISKQPIIHQMVISSIKWSERTD